MQIASTPKNHEEQVFWTKRNDDGKNLKILFIT